MGTRGLKPGGGRELEAIQVLSADLSVEFDRFVETNFTRVKVGHEMQNDRFFFKIPLSNC